MCIFQGFFLTLFQQYYFSDTLEFSELHYIKVYKLNWHFQLTFQLENFFIGRNFQTLFPSYIFSISFKIKV